jgi:hypothetical protein
VLIHSDGSTIDGPLLLGQQAHKMATAPQPDARAAASMMSYGSTTRGKEDVVAATATMAKKAAETKAAEEVTMATMAKKAAKTKAVEEATVVKVAEGGCGGEGGRGGRDKDDS